MAEATIPVDLFNPGQVFACLGFLEAADILIGNAEGGFDWSDTIQPKFRLRVEGAANPIDATLEFLAAASVQSLAPLNSKLATDDWKVQTIRVDGRMPFPIPAPDSPATLPAQLVVKAGDSALRIVIDYWGDSPRRTHRDAAKFWAGGGGYPGAALARDALGSIRERCRSAASDPFAQSVEQTSSFRFDWRRDYIPLEIGFSLNNHSGGRFATKGFPLVEMLAAIGLTNARPERRSALEYRYGVIGSDSAPSYFDPVFLRAALGGSKLPFPQRCFNMFLGWPGKEGQARCITNVTEENLS